MTRVFASFVGGPWDRTFDWVPLCENFDIINKAKNIDHRYTLASIELENLKTTLYIYVSADITFEEALFRIVSCYTTTQEKE